jgi:zinc transport system substrate-binding protein
LPPAIASEFQAPLLEWFGFKVVATYGRAEDFTPQELTRLSKLALDAGVALVADNQQSGPETGIELSRALGIKHVTLSNFPDPDGSYSGTLTENAERLVEALSR